MGTSPLPIMAIIAIYAVVYGMAQGALDAEDIETYGLEDTPEIEAPEGGVFDSISHVFATIGGVFGMVLGVLLFDVPDAPWFIRLPVSMLISGTLTWSLVELARGN